MCDFENLSLEQLLDEAIAARARSQRIERAVCKLFNLNPLGDTGLNVQIVAAVYDGRNHNELMKAYREAENARKTCV